MIDAIKNGDALAFEIIYKNFRGKLFAFFLKKTNSKEDAKDLLQVTFCKLWQYRKSLSSEYSPEQQLFYIARNVFIDYLRKENNYQKIKQSVKTKTETEKNADDLFEFDIKAQLQKNLSAMPAIRKKIFELNKLEGYSYKEIAHILNIPVKSVDNNLAKALRHLRNIELLLIIAFISLLH